MSYFVVHMVTAGLVWKAAALLPRPGSAPETHEPALMRALRALAVVFLQMATMHWLVSAVTMMEAAITWPPLVVVFSGLVALTCLVRCAPTTYGTKIIPPIWQQATQPRQAHGFCAYGNAIDLPPGGWASPCLFIHSSRGLRPSPPLGLWCFRLSALAQACMHVCRVAALGYVFDRYQPKEAAQLHIDSVIGGRFGRRFKWLDRAAVMVVGGSLAGSQTARGGNQSIVRPPLPLP